MRGAPPQRLRLSAEARSMIPWCIVLSASVHVLLLASAAPSGPRVGSLAPRPGAAAPLQMTLVRPTARSLPGDAARPAAAVDVPASVRLSPSAALEAASAASASSARASGEAVLPPEQIRLAASSSSATAAGSTASAEMPPASVAAASGRRITREEPDPWALGNAARGAYLPRPLLSVAPRIQADVFIGMPVGADDGRRHVGVLSLFIDEQGRVRHVEPEEQVLPPALEQAAREAFMAARFSPGEVDGRPVKSRVNVEVAFDGELPQAVAGAVSTPASSASAQRSP